VTNAADPRLILICGLPGAGKTTRAKDLAKEISALRLNGDEWISQLKLNFYDERLRERLERLFWRLTRQLLATRQSVVIDTGFWLRSDRDEKRRGARELSVPVELHFLDVSLDERWRRINRRNTSGDSSEVKINRTQLEAWDRCFQTPADDELALLDPHP